MKDLALIIIGFVFATTNLYSQHTYGIVTCGFDSFGSKQWESIGGGNGAVNLINGVCSDLRSNAYISGEVFSSMTLEGEVLPFGLFAAKYDSNGEFKWVNSMTGGTMVLSSIVTDARENCYVLGKFSQQIASNGVILTSNSSWDVFIIKYDRDGNLVWINSVMKFDYYCQPSDISINEEYNHLYITGAEDSTFPSWNNSKLFVAKCDLTTGNLIKKVEIGEHNGAPLFYSNSGQGIANSARSVYITGAHKNEFGYSDVYVAKFDSSLNVVWDVQYGDNNDHNIGYALALDSNENIYVTGQFSDDITFDSTTLSSRDWADMFLLKLDKSGDFQWVLSAGSNKVGAVGEDFGLAVAVNKTNDVYVSGYVGENAQFSNEKWTSDQGPFLAKYKNDGKLQFAKSFFSGYGNNYKRGSGHIAIDQKNGLIFATNFLHNITICDSLTKTDTISETVNENRIPDFEIYPNPSHGELIISGISTNHKNLNIIVYDFLGRYVLDEYFVNQFGAGELNLDLGDLPTGIYSIVILSNQEYSSKIIQIVN